MKEKSSSKEIKLPTEQDIAREVALKLVHEYILNQKKLSDIIPDCYLFDNEHSDEDGTYVAEIHEEKLISITAINGNSIEPQHFRLTEIINDVFEKHGKEIKKIFDKKKCKNVKSLKGKH